MRKIQNKSLRAKYETNYRKIPNDLENEGRKKVEEDFYKFIKL